MQGNWCTDDAEAARMVDRYMEAIAELRGWSAIIALQVPYNLTERTVERDLLPMAHEMGMGVLPWSPLAGGVLAGKYSHADLEPHEHQHALAGRPDSRRDINLMTGRLTKRALDIADVVKAVAQETGKTPSQVALAWTLLNPAVIAPLVGARTLAQLEDNLASLAVDFSKDQIERLNAVSRIDLGFPHELLGSSFAVQMFGGVSVLQKPYFTSAPHTRGAPTFAELSPSTSPNGIPPT